MTVAGGEPMRGEGVRYFVVGDDAYGFMVMEQTTKPAEPVTIYARAKAATAEAIRRNVVASEPGVDQAAPDSDAADDRVPIDRVVPRDRAPLGRGAHWPERSA